MLSKIRQAYNNHLAVKIITVILVVLLSVVIMLPLLKLAEVFGVNIRENTGLNFKVQLGNVFFFTLFGVCSLFIIWLAQKFIHQQKFSELGFARNAAPTLLVGFVLGVVVVSSKYAIMMFFADEVDPEPAFGKNVNAFSYIGYYLYFFFGFIIWNSLIEEVGTRAYPIQKLKDHMNPHIIFTIMGLIFAMGHFALNDFSIGYFISLFVASYIYSLLYYYSGSIWLTIGMHSGVNWIGFTFFGYNWKLGAIANIEIIGGNPYIMEYAGALVQLIFLGVVLLMKRKGFFEHRFGNTSAIVS